VTDKHRIASHQHCAIILYTRIAPFTSTITSTFVRTSNATRTRNLTRGESNRIVKSKKRNRWSIGS